MLTPITPTNNEVELKSAMIRNPLIVTPETTIVEAIAQMSGIRTVCSTDTDNENKHEKLLTEARSSCVLVVENKQLLGIITERDVVRLSAQKRNLDNLAIRDVMAHPVITLCESEFTDVFFAINLLQHHQIRHLPVIDEQNQLVGILTHESLRQISRPVDLLRLRLVNEVMTTTVICAAPDVTVLAIARLMAENCISSVMIVQFQESRQVPIGIVTERDIVQFQALNLNFETCQAQAVMSTPVFCVNANESLWAVQQVMEQRLIRRLAVTGSQGQLLGIVTQNSILQALSPLELYKLTAILEEKVLRLEAEKIALLENRAVELEHDVNDRTVALIKKIEQDQLITKVAAQIRSSLNLQDILNTTVAEIRSLLKCDRVIIYPFNPDLTGTVIAKSSIANGFSVLHTEPQNSSITSEFLEPYRRGQIRVINDIYSEPIDDCHQDMLMDFNIRAKLMVPILVAGELWGLMLTTYLDSPHNWELDEIELVRQLSIQVSIAIQQANTYQQIQIELRQRQKAESALYQLNQELEAKVKQRTAELQERETQLLNLSSRLELAVKSAEIGIWDWDIVNDCLIWDDRMYELYGITASKFGGSVQAWQAALHPDDAADTIKLLQQAIAEENDFDPEFRIVQPDGKIRTIQAYANIQRNSQGEAQRMIGVNIDITERKQAEQTIQQQAKREHLLQETTQRIRQSLDLDTIFTTAAQEIRQLINADRVVIFKFYPDSNFSVGEFVAESVVAGFNPALTTKIHDHCFGEKYAPYYQQGRIQIINDIDNAELIDCHRNVLAQFQVRANLVVPLLHGEDLWGLLCIHQCSQPRHWQEFEIELVQKIANQLAIGIQQASLFEQLQRSLIKEKEVSQMRSRFISMASHEFRTPLAIISSSTGILQNFSDRLSAEKKQGHLDTIQKTIKNIVLLLDDVLMINRAEAEKMEFKPEALDIIGFCRHLNNQIATTSVKHIIEFSLNTSQPILNDTLVVQFDQKILQQILTNLLTNAIKYSPNDSLVEFILNIQKDKLIFKIKDYGIGIPEKDKVNLFASFHRASNVGSISGTGLGLAIVKKCVDLHQGKITIDSNIDKGTTFTVILPCQM